MRRGAAATDRDRKDHVTTSIELAGLMAEALGLSPETVRHHVRNIGRAGFITRNGRGPHAADMTELDAARLLIATAGSTMTKDSLDTLQRFRSLTETRRRPDADGELPGGATASLEDFLALRIARLRETWLPPRSREFGATYLPRYDLTGHAALELTSPLGAHRSDAPAFAIVRWFTVAGRAEKATFAPAGEDQVAMSAAVFSKRYLDVGLFDTRHVGSMAFEKIALALNEPGRRSEFG
jgi:hypothetical protein